jgi:hypothetical protein
VQQILEAAAELVQLPDYQHVPGPQFTKKAVQLRSIPTTSGSVLEELNDGKIRRGPMGPAVTHGELGHVSYGRRNDAVLSTG